VRPTTAFGDDVFGINAPLHPSTIFDHPRDVLAHPSLSSLEKRAILRPGRPMHRHSPCALRCGRRHALRRPSPSTTSLRLCANWTVARAIHRAAGRTVCVRCQGP
jgi:hypothetical protein